MILILVFLQEVEMRELSSGRISFSGVPHGLTSIESFALGRQRYALQPTHIISVMEELIIGWKSI